METITCGACNCTIATGESYDDAAENAFVDDMEHSCHPESGDWECSSCYHTRMTEAMADYYRNRRVIEAERLTKQAEAERDDFLGRMDLLRDIARGK